MKYRFALLLTMIGLLILPMITSAQSNELAATLEVLEAGVEVQRANTVNWIAVNIEAIVGVGDIIRTDDTGRARITFFADGVDTDLLPNTEYRIEQFEGDGESFTLSVEVLFGQTTQRIGRILDANSNYQINTSGMSLAARGTEFAVRVEDSGRASMLVFEGLVDAEDGVEDSAEVPPEYGIRSAVGDSLSEVVRASTFDELDAALDGCTVGISTVDDVSLNVRNAPSLEAERITVIDPADINVFMGISESGDWYRISLENDPTTEEAYGWVLASTVDLDPACAGLRLFEDTYSESESPDDGEPADAEAD